jgi:hypothetical protein
VVDLGDFATDFGNPIGILLGELLELTPERDGVIDRVVNDALRLGADLGQGCSGSVRRGGSRRQAPTH